MTDQDPRPPWTPHAAPSYAYVAPPTQPAPPIEVRVVAPDRVPGRGLAITGVVLGGLALLGVLMLGLVNLFAFGGGFDGGGSVGGGPTRGVISLSGATALDGPSLATEIDRRVRDEGGEPEGITCPATAKVAQDVTTVCHGNIDGDEWAFVVFFEDATGAYTLLEI